MLARLASPIGLSVQIAVAATLLVAALGIPLAYFMARRRFAGRSVVDALLVVPLVLPPTVVGYLILILLGTRSPVGSLLKRWFDYSLILHWHGAVVASAIVALPLLYLPAKSAFATVDAELEDLAKLLGAGRLQTFWHVSLPMARRGIGSGLLLAFARALGEFGATVMVLGDLPDQQTLPIAIYNDYLAGEMLAAAPAVAALLVVSLGLVILYNRTLAKGD